MHIWGLANLSKLQRGPRKPKDRIVVAIRDRYLRVSTELLAVNAAVDF
jgi:hypothetical protein